MGFTHVENKMNALWKSNRVKKERENDSNKKKNK